MIEEVFAHLAALGLQPAQGNPGSAAAASAKDVKNAPTRFLTPEERARLEARLRALFAGSKYKKTREGKKGKKWTPGSEPLEWTRLRDAAIAAMMLGAGVAPRDVRVMTVSPNFGARPDVSPHHDRDFCRA